MDLTLSRTADYAVRAAISLAEAWGDGYRTIREVAEEMELPPSFTPQVLGLLARAGIAESRAGRGGGYRLARSPRCITMLEVVEAAEGPLANERCTLRGGPCRWDDQCAVHETWTQAQEALRRQLTRTTLAKIAAADLALSG
jgi:Rrf2 family protein